MGRKEALGAWCANWPCNVWQPPSSQRTAPHLQLSTCMPLLFSSSCSYGKSTAMVWKGIGAGLMTILPAMTFTLKVGAAGRTSARSHQSSA